MARCWEYLCCCCYTLTRTCGRERQQFINTQPTKANSAGPTILTPVQSEDQPSVRFEAKWLRHLLLIPQSLSTINTIPRVPNRSKCGRPAGKRSASLGVLQITNYMVMADWRTRQTTGWRTGGEQAHSAYWVLIFLGKTSRQFGEGTSMPKQAPCMYVPCDASMAPAVSWKSNNCCRKRIAWKQGREVMSNWHCLSYTLLLRIMKEHLSPHTSKPSSNKSLCSFELLAFTHADTSRLSKGN